MKLTMLRQRFLLPMLSLAVAGGFSSANADPLALHSSGVTAQKNSDFGHQMDIDGEIAVIGAPDWARLGKNSGKAYVYEKGDDGQWRYSAGLYSPNGEYGGEFGWDVAIDGDHIIVGAPSESTSGNAYIFTRNGPGDWSDGEQLPSSAASSANFGSRVAIEGEWALVGAYLDECGFWDGGLFFAQSGSARLYKKVGGAWVYQSRLVPPSSSVQDSEWYGFDVAFAVGYPPLGPGLMGTEGPVYAICGSPGYDLNSITMNSGRCEIWKLGDGSPERFHTRYSIFSGSYAGYSLAADGPYLAIGANGLGNGAIWTYVIAGKNPTLIPTGVIDSPYSASEGVDFGETMSLFYDQEHGPSLVAGLYIGNAGAYVYGWDDESETYAQQRVLSPPDGHGFESISTMGRFVALGRDEIFVAAKSATKSGNSGYPAVWSFGTHCPYTELEGRKKGDQTGAAIAEIGDLDGDYVNDFAVGSPRNDYEGSNAGKVTIYSGDTCNEVIMTLYGEHAQDRFGHAVARAGDLNGDGINDILVGAPRNDDKADDAGKAYAFSGADGSLLWSRTGPSAGDEFGYSLAGGRFLSGGPKPDIVVGAPKNDKGGSNAGLVRVYDGQTGGKLAELTGDDAGDRFGYVVAMLGKGNGDSHDDFIVGAPKNDEAGKSAGKITVFKGEKWTKMYSLLGQNAGDHFGSAIAGLGVLNSDDRNDFVVGAPKYDTSSKNKCGRIYAFRGDTGAELFKKTGGMGNARLGHAVAIGGLECWSPDNIVIAGAPRWNNRQGRVRMWFETGAGYDIMEGPASDSDYGAAVANINGGLFSGSAVAIGAPRRWTKTGIVDRSEYAFCPIMLATAPEGDATSESELPSADVQIGDLNRDGLIDLHDMLGLLDRIGTADELADMNYDGLIDGKDVMEILKDM